MYSWSVLKQNDYKTTEWSGGTTTELFIFPEKAEFSERDFDIRISSASVNLDESSFTLFPGYTRHIMPCDNEIRLSHDKGEVYMVSPLCSHIFDGKSQTRSAGKCTDFNLFHRYGYKGRLENIQSAQILIVEAGIVCLYNLSEKLSFTIEEDKPIDLDYKESLIIMSDMPCKISIADGKVNFILASVTK